MKLKSTISSHSWVETHRIGDWRYTIGFEGWFKVSALKAPVANPEPAVLLIVTLTFPATFAGALPVEIRHLCGLAFEIPFGATSIVCLVPTRTNRWVFIAVLVGTLWTWFSGGDSFIALAGGLSIVCSVAEKIEGAQAFLVHLYVKGAIEDSFGIPDLPERYFNRKVVLCYV